MLELHLLNGSAPGRSRVVNEDVDFLKPGERFLHNGTDLVRVSDVTSKRQRLNSESPQRLRCLLATLPLPRAKYQVRAHLCQALGHLAPEANRASRNNSHSSCKVKELLGIHGQSCHPRITPPFSDSKQAAEPNRRTDGRTRTPPTGYQMAGDTGQAWIPNILRRICGAWHHVSVAVQE